MRLTRSPAEAESAKGTHDHQPLVLVKYRDGHGATVIPVVASVSNHTHLAVGVTRHEAMTTPLGISKGIFARIPVKVPGFEQIDTRF